MQARRGRVLVADDERTMLDFFEETLSSDWDVRLASDGEEAVALIGRESFDLAFLDLRMPGRSGIDVLRHIRESGRRLPTVLMSAHAGAEHGDELLRGGADLFLAKPFLPETIERTARELSGRGGTPRRLVAEDPAMLRVLERIRRVAPTRATVLLSGETGTGKELLAREVHRRSHRAGRPFLSVNCAALTESLLDSELFGHERGSFTGAVRTSQGLFEAADQGTLLLDEISEISPALQAKLLRVLQEREVRRVGASRTTPVDARIIATTNRDLAREAAAGRFRADLYHRLNVVRIDVPPLRQRPGDLAALTDFVLDKKALEHELPRPAVDPGLHARLAAQAWPGNVRELETALERALLLSGSDVLRAEHLELDAAAPETGCAAVGTTVHDAERALILATLAATRGNRTRAAGLLGLSVRTLRNKLHEYRRSGHFHGEVEP
ncbi:MAG: sigma-54-dependent transcriptional regulator [Candidatus Eiseniibacteriota bacterium]